MKHLLSLILMCLCLLPTGAKTKAKPFINVYSDLHVVEPEIAKNLELQPGERKLINRSAEIFRDYINPYMDKDGQLPKLVLITGDLTEYGDLASHQYVASQLNCVKNAGVPVLVIPGNHDCGKEVSKDEFARIYADFGYNSAVRDPNSLSYVCEPVKGIVILGIDTNGDSNSAIKWAAAQAAKAKGKTVIAMMHHHLFPHFLEEDKLLATSVINNSQAMTDLLIKSGVRYVFTGHTHIHDAAVAYNTEHTDSIIDICTGALSAHPHYYRELRLKGNKIANDASVHKFLVYDAKNGLAPGVPYSEASNELIEKAVPVMVKNMGRKYWDKAMAMAQSLPMANRMLAKDLDWNKVSSLIDINITPYLTQIYLMASMGDEDNQNTANLRTELRNGIFSVVKHVVNPDYQDAALELLSPMIDSKLMPIVNSILDDTNQYSSTPISDISPISQLNE